MNMRTVTALAVGITVATAACRGESFFLHDKASGVNHGPFRLRAGETIKIGTNEYKIVEALTRPPSMRDRLNRTIIPEITFRDAEVKDVIDFLRQASEDFSPYGDPRFKGVNIVFNVPEDSQLATRGITFRARDISLAEALSVVMKTARLQSKVDGNLLIIEPRRGL